MAFDKSKLTGVSSVYPLKVSPYEQYMGDFENPSVVSKINSMIQTLLQMGRLTNQTVIQWNNVMEWIVNGGMDEIATNITTEKVEIALNEVMRMLDVSLNNGLKGLAIDVTDKKISELLASGQFESMIQTSLVEINEVVENKLDGFNLQLANSILKRSLRSFGAKGNANHFNVADSKWYEDSAFTKLASDDTQAIKNFISWYGVNSSDDLILFDRGNYLLTSTIVIPQNCRHIDFNFAHFRYHGANGSFAIQGDIPNEETGGYYYADFKNLYINCSPDKTCNGINMSRLRGSILYNVYVDHADVGIKLNNSWSSELNQCRVYYSKTGIWLANYSNGINISKADINTCDVGIALGRQGVCYGVTINNQTLLQNCLVAIELGHVQQGSIDGAYFELNGLLFDFPYLTDVSRGVYSFNAKNCIFDIIDAPNNAVNFNGNSRHIYFAITDSKINGKTTGTFFKFTTGDIRSIIFQNNSFSVAHTFLELFPSTFHVERVKTDIPYYPTINMANWDIYTKPYILCLGGGNFSLQGSIQRKTDYTGITISSAMPYYMTHETKKFNYLVVQGGFGNTLKKTAKVEVSNNGNLYIYTEDTTDLNPINLNGVEWSVNN